MSSNQDSRHAFTIVELLVAAAITSLIVVMLGSMLGSLTSTASRANQRVDAFRDARAALQMIERDLSTLVAARPAPYFEIDVDLAGPDVRQIYALVATKNRPSGITQDQAGDVCAVRYYCGWDTTKRAYKLQRYFRDSELTLGSFKANRKADGSLNYTDTGQLYYAGGNVDEAVASYVWDLRVTAYDGKGDVINKTTAVDGRETTAAPYICDENGKSNPAPVAIEVSFKAISEAAARTVIAATQGRSDAYSVWMASNAASPSAADQQMYDRLIRPHMYEFRTRINLQ